MEPFDQRRKNATGFDSRYYRTIVYLCFRCLYLLTEIRLFRFSAHLSFKFSFFLHGESTVCTSVDVRQHPPLWRLQMQHLAAAQHSPQTGVSGAH